MDPLTAARLQMAVSLAFHMVFAAVGIGLPCLIVIAQGLYLRTGQQHYKDLAYKWAKVTGLLFAVGAISGTALAFELGLLWPAYMRITGAAVGHLFGLEGYAFFLEAIFLGLYLYGGNRLTPRSHWLCAIVIAVSGALSGWLVLGVNAWMQLPVGVTVDAAGVVTATDPYAIFKTYAWVVMATHSTLSCYIAVAFAVAGIYAYGWLKGRRGAYTRSAIKIALAVGGVTVLLQPLSGDLLAKFVFRTQPAKFAAMEGHFETGPHAPMIIGGWPDEDAGVTRGAIEIPGLLSILADHDPKTVVKGLNDIPRDLWPNVGLTHLAFDVMVGLGTLLIIAALWFWMGWWRRRERLLDSKWLLRLLVICGPCGFIALEAGWVVTEVGRQPWVINGILKTRDAVTTAGGLTTMFVLFTSLYIVLSGTVAIYLWRISKPGYQPIAAPQEAKV